VLDYGNSSKFDFLLSELAERPWERQSAVVITKNTNQQCLAAVMQVTIKAQHLHPSKVPAIAELFERLRRGVSIGSGSQVFVVHHMASVGGCAI
jgi:hypothetical protein